MPTRNTRRPLTGAPAQRLLLYVSSLRPPKYIDMHCSTMVGQRATGQASAHTSNPIIILCNRISYYIPCPLLAGARAQHCLWYK